jgi:hypothetical protein
MRSAQRYSNNVGRYSYVTRPAMPSMDPALSDASPMNASMSLHDDNQRRALYNSASSHSHILRDGWTQHTDPVDLQPSFQTPVRQSTTTHYEDTGAGWAVAHKQHAIQSQVPLEMGFDDFFQPAEDTRNHATRTRNQGYEMHYAQDNSHRTTPAPSTLHYHQQAEAARSQRFWASAPLYTRRGQTHLLSGHWPGSELMNSDGQLLENNEEASRAQHHMSVGWREINSKYNSLGLEVDRMIRSSNRTVAPEIAANTRIEGIAAASEHPNFGTRVTQNGQRIPASRPVVVLAAGKPNENFANKSGAAPRSLAVPRGGAGTGKARNKESQSKHGSKEKLQHRIVIKTKDSKRQKKLESQNKAAAVENSPALNEHGMYFDSFEDASQKLKALRWPPRLDETLPVSSAARRAIVKELYDAMNDMSNFQDKAGRAFRKRWLTAQSGPEHDSGNDNSTESTQGSLPTDDTFYEPWSKEKKCWEILVSRADTVQSFRR